MPRSGQSRSNTLHIVTPRSNLINVGPLRGNTPRSGSPRRGTPRSRPPRSDRHAVDSHAVHIFSLTQYAVVSLGYFARQWPACNHAIYMYLLCTYIAFPLIYSECDTFIQYVHVIVSYILYTTDITAYTYIY